MVIWVVILCSLETALIHFIGTSLRLEDEATYVTSRNGQKAELVLFFNQDGDIFLQNVGASQTT
jgi:hypothetical protein